MEIQTYQKGGKRGSGPNDSHALLWHIGNAWVGRDFTSKDDIKELVNLVHTRVPEAKLIIFQDLQLPELEWATLRQKDLMLSEAHPIETVGFYSAGLDGWEMLPPNKKPIASLTRAFHELAIHMNGELLIVFARLIDHEVKIALEEIALDSAAKYSLEGALKDYRHELSSLLLRTRLEALHAAKKRLMLTPTNSIDSVDAEKQVLLPRKELFDNLEDISRALQACLSLMQRTHSDGLYKKMLLLNFLLETPDEQKPWGKKEVALSLFLQKMQGVLVTLGPWNDIKVKWAAALENALHDYLKHYGEDRLLNALEKETVELPKELQERIRHALDQLEALPHPPFNEKDNPELIKLIGTAF